MHFRITMGMSGPDIYIYLIHIYMHIYINKITQSMIAHPLAHRTSRTSINNYERPSPTKP